CFFFSSRRRHTRFSRDWSSDVCSSDLCNNICSIARDSNSVSHFYKIRIVVMSLIYHNVPIIKSLRVPIKMPLSNQCRLVAYLFRSEERRIGKECRARRSRDEYTKKKSS